MDTFWDLVNAALRKPAVAVVVVMAAFCSVRLRIISWIAWEGSTLRGMLAAIVAH